MHIHNNIPVMAEVSLDKVVHASDALCHHVLQTHDRRVTNWTNYDRSAAN